MIKAHRLIFTFLLAVIALVACNEDPISTGSDLIPDSDKIIFKEFDTQIPVVRQSSSFFQKNIEQGTSKKLLLGKNNYSEAQLLYRFDIYLDDSTVIYLKSNKINVKTAWLEMYPNYSLGEKSSIFDFSVHQIRSTWGSETFDKDSLSHLVYDVNDISFPKSVADTLVKFNIQPNVIFEWLKYKVDSTSAPKNYGLIFQPTANTQRFLGFNAYQLNVENKQSVLHIELERNTGVKDTISVTPFSDTYVLTGIIPNNDGNIYLQGGVALRSSLYFDFSSIPSDVIVTKATLELSIDSLKSVDGKPKSDSILVQMYQDSTNMTLTTDSSLYTILTNKGEKFEGDIAWIIQKWISGVANQGIMLSLTDEIDSAARMVIYGSKNSNISLRPRIKLIYLEKK